MIQSMKQSMKPSTDKYKIRSVDRALRVMMCFATVGPELTSDEIGAAVGLHKSTVYRMLATLEASQFVERSPDGEIYRLGAASVLLGTTALGEMDLPRVARPHLQSLMRSTGETVHLVVLNQGSGLVIDKIDSERSVRMTSSIGYRSPLHCTGAGKVLLAHMPRPELERFLLEDDLPAYTEQTITDPEALCLHLEQIRRDGYALDAEENEPGLRCLAAPVYDYSGTVIASVSLSGPSSRMGSETVPPLRHLLLEHTGAISRELGY